jgi:toxin ParE1/3/4
VNLFVTQEAEQDLVQIEDYIGKDNPSAAVRFVQRLTDRFAQLAEFPGIGRERVEYARGLRSVTEGDYVIFYRLKESNLEILRVLHGRRDIKRILQSSPPD